MAITDPEPERGRLPTPSEPDRRVGKKDFALIVYLLYLAGFFNGITVLIGLILAYIQRPQSEPWLASHHTFQIRTVWIGLLYVVAGLILAFVLVGILIWIWWAVWTIIRCIKGLIALNEGRPIEHPQSWGFG